MSNSNLSDIVKVTAAILVKDNKIIIAKREYRTKGSRGRGIECLSEKLKNYKELKVWQRSYQLCLEIYKITKGFSMNRKWIRILSINALNDT